MSFFLDQLRAFVEAVEKGTDMREHVLLFCLLGLVLTATIILLIAPGAVTWALALIE